MSDEPIGGGAMNHKLSYDMSLDRAVREHSPTDGKVLLDHEFHFTSGDPLFFTLEQDRDQFGGDDQHIIAVVLPDPHTTEEYTVVRAKVNYHKRTRRVIEPEGDRHS